MSRTDLDQVQAGIEELVGFAIENATSLAEVLDCAEAAAAIGTPELLEAMADRIASEVEILRAGSSAWHAELEYSKVEAWSQTGHKARLLAEAFGRVAPALRAARARA